MQNYKLERQINDRAKWEKDIKEAKVRAGRRRRMRRRIMRRRRRRRG